MTLKKTQIVGLLATALSLTLTAWGQSNQLNPQKIEELTGLKGQMNEKEKVFKVSFQRTDLEATVAGVKMTPALGLTGWAAFTPVGNHVMMMGDTVLSEDQVNPVMSVALDNGLEVTALHNHFFSDNPRVMFMHIGGMGDQEKLATAVGKVYAKVKETLGAKSKFQPFELNASESKIDPKKIDAVLQHPGELNKGIYKVNIGRTVTMEGHKMGNAMGVNTWAAFAGTDDQAIVDGDFAMLETELQGVLKALRKANINIVAIHNHMTLEKPRMMFLHFWGVGPTAQLAHGIKAALDTQKQ
jgi:hypothetical protein